MISVIIPTYNRASYLKEALESVLAQNYWADRPPVGDFELLVVDDGSTDRTREVVGQFGGRVSYHFQAHVGVSSARNLGLRLAKGDYVGFLDSDDLWKREKIQVQMSLFKAFPQAMVCYTEEVWIRNGRHLNPANKHRKYSGWIFDKVLPLCLLSLSSALFRREVFEEIGNFDETLPACEDYDFGIRLAHRYPVHLVTNPLIIKRGGHPDQLSRLYWGMDRFRVQALEKALCLGLTSEQERLVREEIIRKSRILVKGFENRRNTGEAAKYRRLIDKYGFQLNRKGREGR
jgi:glycosyltransferase involved in cell wall biosynthesis